MSAMDTATLIAVLDRALQKLSHSTDELRDLDAALGDGDLGITVSSGSAAVRTALAELSKDAMPAELIRVAAGAFMRANPSTFAALVGGALLAGARSLGDVQRVDRASALRVGRVAAESIAQRGKTKVGDKTMLDAIVPALEAMESAEKGKALDDGIRAAEAAVESTKELQSQKGRAAWMGERSKGLQDPGATAVLRFLQALKQA